jgi:hypothetical protein
MLVRQILSKKQPESKLKLLRKWLIVAPVVLGLILVSIFLPAQQVTIDGIGTLSFEMPIAISAGQGTAHAAMLEPPRNEDTPLFAYYDVISALNPDFWYKLDQNGNDSGPNINNSDGGNAPDFVASIIPSISSTNYCGDHNGSDDGYTIPNHSLINSGTTYQRSYSVWINADTIDTSNSGRIIWSAGGQTNGEAIYVVDVSGEKRLYFCVYEGSNFDYVYDVIAVDTLYHVGATLDCDAGEMYLYLNGSEVASKTGGLAIGSDFAGHQAGAAIGHSDWTYVRNHEGSSSQMSGYFDGEIADLVLWSTASGNDVLTESDFYSIYDAGISTDEPPAAPTLYNIPFEYEQTADLTPAFRFSATDPDGTDDIHYQIQIDDNHNFGSTFFDHNSSSNPTYFSNITTPADTPPFNEGDVIEYVPPSDLTDDTVWFWRVRAQEDGESWGDWTEIASGYYCSVSTDDSLSDSRWFQTADEQFETGTQYSVTVSGGSVSLTTGGSISRLDASASGTSSTLGYSVSSGSNRVLIVHIGWESTANDTAVSGVTYGGQSMTEAFQIATPDSGYSAGVASYYILDAGIAAASGNTISPSFSGTSPDDIMITAASYEGVNQTGGSTTVPETHTAETNESTPNPFTTIDITETSGNLVVAAITCGNSTSFTWHSDMTEQEDVAAASSATGFADRLAVTGSNVTIEATVADQNRAAAGSAEFVSASTSSGSLVSRTIDYDWLTGASDWGQLIFTDDESAGDIKYDIEYWDGDSWEDTSIVNQDSSPVDISALDGTTHNQIRIEATLTDAGGTPYLNDWAIAWSVGGAADISNLPGSIDFGNVTENSSYWSTATNPPTWPLDDLECYFEVTNNSTGAVDISIKATDFIGGDDWTLAGSPGAGIVTLKAGKSGDNNEGDMVTLTNGDQSFISDLGASSSTMWEIKLETGTFTDSVQKNSTITLTATLA